ncbi:MAG TPA: aminotransferase class I/II-fold pyridoxal phosphate-dependent enzyme, partial [Oceanithermus sp.]|nr:aminotransferase class I/II-fold pyridoxal phosphate-dependent enzyme [Oceanithermus sp.]
FNQYAGILRMGIRALELPLERIRRDVRVFKKRRDALLVALRRHGIVLPAPKASLYLWMPLPRGMDDVRFALRLAEEAGVALAPGQGFGPGGKGYVRFALVQPPEVLEEAARRIAAFLD